MDRFNNIENGGFLVSGATMMKIDEMIGQVADFAVKTNGDNYIASGVEDLGNGSYSDGYIVWNGEILPFSGGAFSEQITILEETVTATYKDGQEKGYYKKRFAKFGTDGVSFFDFDQLKPIYARFAEQVFQNGIILPWNKEVADMPRGFAPCDGVDDRPDLGGRSLVGYDSSRDDYNEVGKTGGLESVKLTTNEMPSHKHDASTGSSGEHTHTIAGNFVTDSGGNDKDSSGDGYGQVEETNSSGSHTHTISISNTGGNQAHENRSPYYVANYMMWVGF